MNFLKVPNQIIAGIITVFSAVCLVILCVMTLYGVIMRYVFEDAVDYVEPIALLMVLVIAFFGAALRVRDGGHIGLDSLVDRLPPKGKAAMKVFQHVCLIIFAVAAFNGCLSMAEITVNDSIPIIGLSEAIRFIIPAAASACIVLFCLEHLLRMIPHKQN